MPVTDSHQKSSTKGSQVVFREGGRECRLDYDKNIFGPGALDAEHYLRFPGSNKDTYFRVTALPNNENLSPEKIRQGYLQKKGGHDLVYDRTNGQFLVLSGYRGRNIFYTKISMSADNKIVCVLDIFYPREFRRAFDSQVTRMSRSFAAQQ